MRKILFILCLLQSVFAVQAQQNNLSGFVKDFEDGQALEKAYVRLANSKRYIFTDSKGHFKFNDVEFPDTLIVTYLGYQPFTQIITNTDVSLNINLQKQENTLQEVIVNTGYQKLKAGRATGSFSLVDSALFNRQVGTDVFRRLEGITPGILFDKRGGEGNVTRFSIRGLSTLTSGTTAQPLIILDNFPYEGDVANINPNDVESITVLKDAAAASIWGTRAGNGVVVITTRGAKFNRPLQFSLVANTSISEKPDLYAYPSMSSADFLSVEKYLYDRGFYASSINNTRNRPVLSPYIELLEAQKAGRVSAAAVAAQLQIWEQTDQRNDFDTYFQREAIKQQYSLNFSAGAKQLSYVGSLGFDRNISGNVGDDQQRLTMRNQLLLKPTQKINLQAGIIYTQNKGNNNGIGAFGSLRPNGGKSSFYPYVSFADANGNALAVEQDYRKNYIDTAGRGLLFDWAYRPLDEIEIANNSTKSRDLLFDVQGDYQVLPALKASLQYRYQNTLSAGDNQYGLSSYFTRNLINRYTQIVGNNVVRPVPLGGITDYSRGDLNAHAFRGQLNFNKAWQKQELDVLVGSEIRQTAAEGRSGRSFGFDELNYLISPVDLVNSYPIYGTLASNTTIPDNSLINSFLDRNVSYYLSATYDYDRRYTLSLSARKDASNLFGVKANQKGVPLGSLGAAWHIDQESFYNSKILPRLNLRASFGYSGNVNNSVSALTTIRYDRNFLGINTFTGLPQATIINPPNPELRWERVGIFNTSLDFATQKDRISGQLSYFNKYASDLIGQVVVDATTGGTGLRSLNSATLRNQGMELQVQTLNFTGKVKWNSNFLLSSSKTKVLQYLYTPSSPSFYIGNGSSIGPIPGQPAYGIYSYRWAGLDPQTGDPQVMINGIASKDYTGIPNKATFNDLVFHGSAVPLYFGAIRNDFSYRNLSLSMNISFKLSYFYRRNGISYNSLYNQWAGSADYALRWQKAGDENTTKVPSMVYPANSNRDNVYTNSSIMVEKGDHLRIQDVRLAYALPAQTLKRLSLKQLSVFVYANNLGIIWKASKYPFDPEYGTSFLPVKTINFGLKTDF